MRNFAKVAFGGDPLGAIRWFSATARRRRTTVRLKIRGETVYIRTCSPDLDVALSCFLGEFDELIRSVPQATSGLVIDAGGYIGTAAMVFAKAYPEAIIVTVEPSLKNFKVLERNVARYPNIVSVRAAVDSTQGRIELRDRMKGGWGLTIVADPEDGPGAVIDTVDRVTIADLMDQVGCHGIDILKLDIEGGEKSLLARNTEWIAHTKAVCIELHDRIVSGCTEAFEAVTFGRKNTKLEGEKYLSLGGCEG
jgi:FkbM family methyltransferase